MKVALVHELLTMRGGAEKLLKVVSELFPEALIYTLLYDEKKLGNWFPKERVQSSRLQKYAPFSTNHHLYLKSFPEAVEGWDFSEYDLVLSFSSAFTHGIITRGKTKHICYVNSPARYLWDQTFDVQKRANTGVLGSLRKLYLERTFHKLRQWDAHAGSRGDLLLAASKTVQRRIELYWRRESTVVYPPVDISAFDLSESPREDFYVLASTLVPYKRVELAIEACNTLERKLRIIGEGPHKKRLMSIAGPTIEFLGFIPHEKLVQNLQSARAFIFPGEEDFGIAPIEAMACGTPVIAYGKGGALETIHDGKTGLFFYEASPESLTSAIQDFDTQNFSPTDCRAQAERFDQDRFKKQIQEYVMKNVF